MKRFAVFLLAGMLTLSLAGCSWGGDDASPSPSTSPTTETSPSPDGGAVGDIAGGVGDAVGDIAGGVGDAVGDITGTSTSEPGGASGEQGGTSSEPNGGTGDSTTGTNADYSSVTDVKSFFGVVESAYETDLPSMMDLDDTTLQDTYGVDPALLDEYVAKIPMMNVHATEFFAAKVKSGEMDKVVEGINSRLESLDQTWANYLPDQYELVKNHQLVQEGDYVLLAIGTHAEEIAQSFRGVFAEK